MGIEEIVKVDIVRGTRSITRAGFGTGIIFSSEAVFTGVRTYNSIASVEADFATSTSVYKFAAKYFGQERKPRQLKIARRTAKVAQVNTIKILNNTNGTFTVTIDGVDYSFVAAGSTIAQIRTGLIAAINAATAVHDIVAANGLAADEFTLTAQTAGVGHSVTVTANLLNTLTTANNGVQEDIIAAENADSDFYAVILTSRDNSDILQAAALIQTRRKIFLACTASADVLNNVALNVAAQLKAKGYTRTALLYSGDQANGPEAAWAGRVLPLDAGSETWKFKDLVGIVADKITDTQLNNLKLNNVNNYRTFAGFSMTSEGVVAMGEFIDVIRFIDQVQAWLEEEIFTALISVPKIPYTDNGVATIENIVRMVLQRGIGRGGFRADPAPSVSVPKVADIAIGDRSSRTLPDVTFDAQLAGAIHFVNVLGTVSV